MSTTPQEKLAAETPLSPDARRRIATYSFMTTLSSPAVGMPFEQVKSAAAKFSEGMRKFADRHVKLVDMLTEHVKAPANA